jgi:hypothetical protein
MIQNHKYRMKIENHMSSKFYKIKCYKCVLILLHEMHFCKHVSQVPSFEVRKFEEREFYQFISLK